MTDTYPTFGFIKHRILSQTCIDRPFRVLILYNLKYHRSYIV